LTGILEINLSFNFPSFDFNFPIPVPLMYPKVQNVDIFHTFRKQTSNQKK
jgi:hypothetical protein